MNMFSSGDELVEWNGRSSQGATFEEVCDIILIMNMFSSGDEVVILY